ncbi:MAG: hypothetical protein K9L17_13175 [Clostridiales bacterium]|nr:hypothetical protein [Clostridiales bacterium]MCF8023631.1 hypothetical protein [Clostridiales bacterium]
MSETNFSGRMALYPLEDTTMDKLAGTYDINVKGFNIEEGESTPEIFDLMSEKTDKYLETEIFAQINKKQNNKI